jgi:hypothetical protein
VLKLDKIGAKRVYIKALDDWSVLKSFGAQRTSTRRTGLTLEGIVGLDIFVFKGDEERETSSVLDNSDTVDCTFNTGRETTVLFMSTGDGRRVFVGREVPFLNKSMSSLMADSD